jgi:hypothetical protein
MQFTYKIYYFSYIILINLNFNINIIHEYISLVLTIYTKFNWVIALTI